MSSNFDDDFDWEAAVAEIDKACSRRVAPENGRAELASSQSRTFQQKTLDSFVGGGVRESSHAAEEQAPHGRKGEALDSSGSRGGNQWCAGTDVRPRQVVSDNETEASSSGCRLPLDYDAAKIWIYPENVPRRSYQFNITKSALFSNTLVCLPTGLGKTLIAAVVMYNYFRWFPTGKIVFAAPSRPLVVQQIEACHKVTGITQEMTIDMTGQMNPQIRAEHWQSRRVFFVTPQVLEKDIQAGRAATKQIVCLVVDEAHRATGNYSYCVVIRELLAAKVEPRILALTATPGSKQITIQAVVDNLQISCLEYRDEYDPDVSQYTHNRQIELIEVAMNAESIQVKDVFIEVLQPIVHRLCYLGVFYSREIPRLSPYEFLTARDKFRQAPPQALEQSKYQDVESYFGLAITLFHIFKLLITHGMRPAHEMLRQKVEQGVLRRLAKNEKLLQVQELMKQSIGHGAPSPKLEKVVDIINDHFRVHDATNTRVIIFTNFRESVKDIMDKLVAACESVKAMEFIGQSSGKSSKGQTQKTQQAVLQRFRGGAYNTIVATSIAEEGLDIMEVDLVICFDANISPLRMIQRMGRTGRKRDGRVVVLASGGSEIQGYLKKQSKSKALGKHMLHGGVQSFNFHASHHMIPHSLRTTVQFKELAIETFVPRGRKLKERELKAGAGPRKLTEKELEMVRSVKAIPDLNPRMKGGPEDPVNKFFASPVYRVKHSKRSCLLMDCLQTLGVPVHLASAGRISSVNNTSPSPIEIPAGSNVPLPVREVQVPTFPIVSNLSDDDSETDSAPKMPTSRQPAAPPVSLSSSACLAADPCTIATAHPKDPPRPEEFLSAQRQREEMIAGNAVNPIILDSLEGTQTPVPYRDQADGDDDHLENAPLKPIANKVFSPAHTLSGDRQAKVVTKAAEQRRSFLSFDQQSGADFSETRDRRLGTGFRRCRLSPGVVPANQSGVDFTASPPSLITARKGEAKGLPGSSHECKFLTVVNSEALQQSETEANNGTGQRQTPIDTNHGAGHATPVRDDVAMGLHTIAFVAESPEENVLGSLSNEARLQNHEVHEELSPRSGEFTDDELYEELSPRLGEFAHHEVHEALSPRLVDFANHGVVPSTPGKETTPVSDEDVSVPKCLSERASYHPSDGRTHISTALAILNCQNLPGKSVSRLSSPSVPVDKDVRFQVGPPHQTMCLPRVSALSDPVEGVSPQRIVLTHTKITPLTFDSVKADRLPRRDQASPEEQSVPEVNNGRRLSNVEGNVQLGRGNSKQESRSPLQILSSKSGEEDWRMKEDEAAGSVQKPRKLKWLPEEQSVPEVNNGRRFSDVKENVQLGRCNSKQESRSPLQILSSESGEEDWRMKEDEAAGSVQKPRKLKRLPEEQSVPEVNNGRGFSDVKENVQLRRCNSKQESRSPLQILSSESGEEDWQMKEDEAAGSVQKPRKLKRLPEEQSVPEVNNGRRLSNVEENVQLGRGNSKQESRSPLQILSSKSGEEDWRMKEDEAAGSVQKPRRLKRLPEEQSVPEVNNGRRFSDVEENVQLGRGNSKQESRSPLQILSSKSGEEDWRMKEEEAAASVQKPRKLKRLRRACENESISTAAEGRSKRNLNSSVQDPGRSTVHQRRLGRDKHQRHLAARTFIDEEAEVSSEDDDLSDDDDCEDEAGSSLEGFIDTAATQHLNGSVDMINIYRKSLLTQSPVGYLEAQQIHLQRLDVTPSSDATPSSIDLSSASRCLEDESSDLSAAPRFRRPAFARPKNIVQASRTPDPGTDSAKDEGKCMEAIDTGTALGAKADGSEHQDGSKAELRKRKLSFPSSPNFEDDLFEGVDLDALEAEATELSRMRTQGQATSSNAIPEPVVATRPASLPCRPTNDNEFEFIPSFDLGFGT